MRECKCKVPNCYADDGEKCARGEMDADTCVNKQHASLLCHGCTKAVCVCDRNATVADAWKRIRDVVLPLIVTMAASCGPIAAHGDPCAYLEKDLASAINERARDISLCSAQCENLEWSESDTKCSDLPGCAAVTASTERMNAAQEKLAACRKVNP